MILYNITSSVDPEVAEQWVAFMREQHMPDIMATGFFVRSQLLRLLNEEEDGCTYAAQFYCASTEQLDEYQQVAAPGLRADLETRFPGQYVSFRTVLEVIE
jgi:Domain of unknown function (DUF4286)